MKIEIEVNSDVLSWIIGSLYASLDDTYDPSHWDINKTDIIEYLESKQNEN